MGNILLTREPTSARFFLLWSLGIGMLWAPLADSLALPPKPVPGKIYCQCRCSAGAWENKDLSWEKKAHCALNGRSCKIRGADGKWRAGKLLNCEECKHAPDVGWLCLPMGAGPRGDIILDPPDVQLKHPPTPGKPSIR
jgi:hypothetical protein